MKATRGRYRSLERPINLREQFPRKLTPGDESPLAPVMAELRELKESIQDLRRRLDNTLDGGQREFGVDATGVLNSPRGAPGHGSHVVGKGHAGLASCERHKDGFSARFGDCTSRLSPSTGWDANDIKDIGELVKQVEASARAICREKEAAVEALRAEDQEKKRLVAAIEEANEVKRRWEATTEASCVLKQRLESSERIRRRQKELIVELQAVEADIAFVTATTKSPTALRLRHAQQPRFSLPTPRSAPLLTPPRSLTPCERTPQSIASSLEEYGFVPQDENIESSKNGKAETVRCSPLLRWRRPQATSPAGIQGEHWTRVDHVSNARCSLPSCATPRNRANVEPKTDRGFARVSGTRAARSEGGEGVRSDRERRDRKLEHLHSSTHPNGPRRPDRHGGNMDFLESHASRMPRQKSKHEARKDLVIAATVASRVSAISTTPSRVGGRGCEAFARCPPPSPSTPTIRRSSFRQRGFLTPTAASAGKTRRSRGSFTPEGEGRGQRVFEAWGSDK